MWSISTKPCPIITWDGVVFNGEHLYVDHIYYMIHAWPFGLSVPRPYLHMLGSSSLTRVFCVCKTGLPPLYVNVELITPDHHVLSQHEELSQRCILRENTIPWNFSKGSSYKATAELSKIRCIKDKHHIQSKYVTWYGHHHLVPLIPISKAPSWFPSSPAWHLDLHRSIVVVSPTIASPTIAAALSKAITWWLHFIQ